MLTISTFKEAIRAKWLVVFTVVFFFLVINIPILGLFAARYLPPEYLQQYLPTFLGVLFPYIPLLALPMGSGTVVEERESGTLQYMMSNPISKAEFLAGRMVGMLLATTLVVVAGLGVAALVAQSIQSTTSAALLSITLVATTLNAVMLMVAFVISILAKRKSTAMGVAIFMWFFFTVLTDIGLLGIILNLTAGSWAAISVILLNPVETSRILAVIAGGGGVSDLGANGITIRYYMGSSAVPILSLVLMVWLVVSFAVAFLLFRHQDTV